MCAGDMLLSPVPADCPGAEGIPGIIRDALGEVDCIPINIERDARGLAAI